MMLENVALPGLRPALLMSQNNRSASSCCPFWTWPVIIAVHENVGLVIFVGKIGLCSIEQAAFQLHVTQSVSHKILRRKPKETS
jgi:hypothetical protein